MNAATETATRQTTHLRIETVGQVMIARQTQLLLGTTVFGVGYEHTACHFQVGHYLAAPGTKKGDTTIVLHKIDSITAVMDPEE